MFRALLLVTVLVLSFAGHTLAFANEPLVFSAPPRETPEVGQDQYGPIAEFMGKVLGRSVEYRHPGNWLSYQRDMRNGMYDLVFDGPHFASWRINKLNHHTLVKLPGDLQFYLLTSTSTQSINNTSDMIGKKFCGPMPPNLSSLSILDRFPNPSRQPDIVGVKGFQKEVFDAYKNGECDAFVMHVNFYRARLTDEERFALKMITESRKMPNQVITAGPRVNEKERVMLQHAMLDPVGQQALEKTLKRFSPNANAFVYAASDEYTGLSDFLEGVILGW